MESTSEDEDEVEISPGISSDDCRSSSDVSSEPESSELKCYSCLEEIPSTYMFLCRTCLPDLATRKNETVELAHDQHLYCKICIVGHLRRKHDVKDHKGYKPAVCQKHKNLCQYYCKACQEVFCPDCTITHSSHVFQLVEEKAAEIRPKIFEYITTNEMMTKPLKHKQATTDNCVEEKSELRSSLGVFRMTTTLRQLYDNVICSNETKWCNIVKNASPSKNCLDTNASAELHAVIAESDKKHLQLRELLQMSDGNLVKCFYSSRAEFKKLIKDQAAHLMSHTYLQWTEDLSVVIANSIQEMLNTIQIPAIESIQMEEIELCETSNFPRKECQVECEKMEVKSQARNECFGMYVDELFGLNISKDKCSLSILKEEDRGPSIQKVVCRNVEVKHIFSKVGYIAICTNRGSFTVYCLNRKVFVYQFQTDKNCLPLSLHIWTDGTFSCLAWLSESSQVKSTPKYNQTLTLPEQPKLIGHFIDICSFVHSKSKVTIWNTKEDTRMELSNLQHGLSSVDNMKLTDKKTLFLFDYRLQLVVKFEFDLDVKAPRKCTLVKAQKISPFSTDPLKLMTVICGKIVACSNYEKMYSAERPI